MDHAYNRGSLPPAPKEFLAQLDAAVTRLGTKLKGIQPASLGVSEYGLANLEQIQKQLDQTLKKYAHIVAWALFPVISGGHETFIDYGGGHGVMACLAKEFGVRRVVYNDIFEGCISDAKILAKAIGCPADEYVCGDILSVQEALRAKPASSCALTSINVIEHIYDMDEFLRITSSFVSPNATLLLSTSANPLNPLVRRRHHRQHNLWEFHDGPHPGSYPMDTPKAFLTVRRDIIAATAPALEAAQIAELAERTRGLKKDDIERAVGRYLETKTLPPAPDHPTNTCDPFTGSWQERLLDIPHVRQVLAAEGFKVRIFGGYYDDSTAKKAAKRLAAKGMNYAISAFGEQGVRLAPCFMFQAFRRA